LNFVGVDRLALGCPPIPGNPDLRWLTELCAPRRPGDCAALTPELPRLCGPVGRPARKAIDVTRFLQRGPALTAAILLGRKAERRGLLVEGAGQD